MARPSCDSHGHSCIRVRKSHVLTMLLLAFALRPPALPAAIGSGLGKAAAAGSAAAQAPTPAAQLLMDAVERTLESSSPLLRHEAHVIREQLRDARCSLIE